MRNKITIREVSIAFVKYSRCELRKTSYPVLSLLLECIVEPCYEMFSPIDFQSIGDDGFDRNVTMFYPAIYVDAMKEAAPKLPEIMQKYKNIDTHLVKMVDISTNITKSANLKEEKSQLSWWKNFSQKRRISKRLSDLEAIEIDREDLFRYFWYRSKELGIPDKEVDDAIEFFIQLYQ